MKRLIFIFLQISLLIFFANTCKGESTFIINQKSTYLFNENGEAKVSENYSITNNTTEKYLPSFEYELGNTDAENINVIYNNQDLHPIVVHNDKNILLKINFPDKVLGKNKVRDFIISYSTKEYSSKTGDVWELTIPKNNNLNEINNLETTIIVPKLFGHEAYISPSYENIDSDENNYIYHFSKTSLEDSGIVLGYGEYQVFKFSIDYYLENKKSVNSEINVSFPPDTSYQRVFFDDISPKPLSIKVDQDGNWIAKYKLKKYSDININIKGSVQLFANPRKHLIPPIKNLYENIKATKYWPSEDENIVNLSKSLISVKDKYDYVVNNFEYDYSLSAKERKSPPDSIINDEKFTCRDYADLLITLLRSNGIPAREVVGYAYTDNQDIKPIAFFNDILHSWVEYWDYEEKIWRSVDPTWEVTSKNDYFNKFDMRHFAFTIHGSDDSSPYPPGFYNNKDSSKNIFVEFGTLDPNINLPLNISVDIPLTFIFNRQSYVKIKNPNSYAIYDKNIKYFYDDKLIYEDKIELIPPLSEINKNLNFNYSFFGVDTPSILHILVNNKNITLEGPKTKDLYSHTLLLLTFIVIVTLILLRIKYNKLQNK